MKTVCPICGSSEPGTGTCGSSSPRALCNLSPIIVNDARNAAAAATLEMKGYEWRGGKFWAPPIGRPPAYISLVPDEASGD